MALFGGSRDINLFHTINSELLNDIIQTEIGYYKFVLDKTVSNVYGESADKMFYEPVRIACLINKEDQSWSSDDFGSDINQSINFRFLKNELKELLDQSTSLKQLERKNQEAQQTQETFYKVPYHIYVG